MDCQRTCLSVIILLTQLFLLLSQATATPASASDEGLLGAFWHGKAHFRQVRTIAWDAPPYDSPGESSGWVATHDGKWYIFNRQVIPSKPPYCPNSHARVVVRESSDHGRTWSNPPVVVADPSNGNPGDGCTILDGSSYYDHQTNTWQLIAQCLDRNNRGGWMLCHYTRPGSSPVGQFVPDPRNPVVKSGELWSRICSGIAKACDPRHTHDEGTPDIIMKKDDYFYVTFHGFDDQANRSYRGIAKTKDFHSWSVAGGDMPGDAIMAPIDCQAWDPGCTGPGQASTLITGGYQYMLVEGPNKSLLCKYGQNWVFGLLRAPRDVFPRWNGGWKQFARNPILVPSWPGPRTMCGVRYARWIVDANEVYLLYEDVGPQNAFTVRRLLKLVAGSGPPVALGPNRPSGQK
jgi:hypothetical protein